MHKQIKKSSKHNIMEKSTSFVLSKYRDTYSP
jgi:hypothetical protein